MKITIIALVTGLTLILQGCESVESVPWAGGSTTSTTSTSSTTSTTTEEPIAVAGTLVQLTDTTSDSSPNGVLGSGISDDGKYVLLTAYGDLAGNNGGAPFGSRQLFVMDASSKAVTQLTDHTTESCNWARISGDGTKVVYIDGSGDIYTVNRDGTNKVLVGNHYGPYYGVGFPPDGSYVVFQDGDNTPSSTYTDIVKVASDGSTIETVLDLNPDATIILRDLTMSADGSKVIFATNETLDVGIPSNEYSHYIVDVASQAATELLTVDFTLTWHDSVPSSGDEYNKVLHSPDLSSDGAFVVFNSYHDLIGSNPSNKMLVFRLDVGTGTIAQLTDESLVDAYYPYAIGSGVGMLSSNNLSVVYNITADAAYVMNADGTGASELINRSVNNPFPDGGASIVIFGSYQDLVEGSNTDRSAELFMLTR